MHQYISFAFLVVFVIIQLFIINYLIKLEKIGCECAMDWRRNYIMVFFVLSVLYAIIAPVIDESVLPYVQAVYVVLGILNVIYVIQYVYRLKKEKCACSEAVMREVMLVMAIFNAIIYSFALTMIIFLLFTLSKLASSVNRKTNKLSPIRKPSAKLSKTIKKILKRK